MNGNKRAENMWVVALVLIIMAVLIFSVDTSPLWIYQGF